MLSRRKIISANLYKRSAAGFHSLVAAFREKERANVWKQNSWTEISQTLFWAGRTDPRRFRAGGNPLCVTLCDVTHHRNHVSVPWQASSVSAQGTQVLKIYIEDCLAVEETSLRWIWGELARACITPLLTWSSTHNNDKGGNPFSMPFKIRSVNRTKLRFQRCVSFIYSFIRSNLLIHSVSHLLV